MEDLKPKILESNLKINNAFSWLKRDSSDDFYPDVFLFEDICMAADSYFENRKHRMWQLDTLDNFCEYVPKKNGLLRTAHWIHPTHRLYLLSILHYLIGKIDHKLSRSLYSYRLENIENLDNYPFPNRIEGWKAFINNFRDSALAPTTNAVVLTDLASFFDHISCEKLIERIKNIIGNSFSDIDDQVLNLLHRLLNLWSIDGFGIPQNIDICSFLGNLYLNNVDIEISRKYKYFRYVDDIRLVADSEEEAMQALHDLQRALAMDKLFLASDKTRIVLKDSGEFQSLVDVEDDVLLSESEEAILSGCYEKILAQIDKLYRRLDFHSNDAGDDRKFRAFMNRLLSIGDFEEFSPSIHSSIIPFVLPRLRSHPHRSDYWVRALSTQVNNEVINSVIDLLITRPSVFDWQKFHLWKLAMYIEEPPQELINKAIETCVDHGSENVAAQAVLFIGKHGNNTERENVYRHLTNRRSYVFQRSILIALQELPDREKYFSQAITNLPDHKELVNYLLRLKIPSYGEKPRTIRHCKEIPLEVEALTKQGVGMIKGQIVQFRLLNSDIDY